MAEWLGLEDCRVLVAGGAGALGEALVKGFLNAGAQVGAADVSGDGLARIDDRVVATRRVDLRDAGACRAAVASTRERMGGLDIFVHCVGINDRKAVERYSAEEWDRIIATNLTSAFHTATEAALGMRDQRHGRIIFVSSVAGRSGHKHHGPYAASKGAINQLMRVIAHEYAEHGVTANAVAPGYMDTALTHDYLANNPDKRRALIELIPAGRFGRLEEIVGPILFLASRHASFVTGQVLYIDGGRTII